MLLCVFCPGLLCSVKMYSLGRYTACRNDGECECDSGSGSGSESDHKAKAKTIASVKVIVEANTIMKAKAIATARVHGLADSHVPRYTCMQSCHHTN